MFFDPVFHLTPRTIKVVVEPLRTAFQIGQHIARIDTPIALFRLGDAPPFLVPSLGLVLELTKESDFQTAAAILSLSAFLQLGTQRIEALLLANPTI